MRHVPKSASRRKTSAFISHGKMMATMYAKGVLVVPKFMQQAIGVNAPSKVSMWVEGRRIIIESKDDSYARWRAEFSKAIADANLSDEQVAQEIRLVEEKRKKRLLDVP